MPWLQLSIDAPEEQAPLIELLLENLGAVSVTLGDAGDQPLLEPLPGEEPHWRNTRITGLFEASQDADALRASLNRALNQDISRTMQLEILQDQAWERAWLQDYQPLQFGRRLCIGPESLVSQKSDKTVVILDPGLAFGTGTHPTTALCLEWLDSQNLQGKTLIDYGCGSGILAVAALRLGAAKAIAIDHDPQALQATEENALKNRVLDRISLHTPDNAPQAPQDLLVANILAQPLINLAETLCSLMQPDANFALSGILEEQTEAVRQAYLPQANLHPIQQREEWVLLSGTRI